MAESPPRNRTDEMKMTMRHSMITCPPKQLDSLARGAESAQRDRKVSVLYFDTRHAGADNTDTALTNDA